MSNKARLIRAFDLTGRFLSPLLYFYGRFIKTHWKLLANRGDQERWLEIGPGPKRIAGFETVNIVWGLHVDYVADASKGLPFPDNCFDLIYASHMLEHVPWYKLSNTLAEWFRVLKSGGCLEVWVPNGLLIAKTWVYAEEFGINGIHKDGWYRFNTEKDSAIWANGRMFSYGDGSGRRAHPNWHLAMFSPRFLKKLLTDAGFVDILEMKQSEVRGFDHGWINLGMRASKP